MSATNSISSRFDLIRPRLRNVFIHLMMSNANRSNEKNIELFIADHSYQYLAHTSNRVAVWLIYMCQYNEDTSIQVL
jgi:hypothetical protein